VSFTCGRISQNVAYHGKRGSRARFQHRHQHTAIAILADNIRLRNAAVADAGHIMQIDNHSVRRLLHGQISQSRDCHWSGIQMNVIFVVADFGSATRLHHVLERQRVQNFGRRDPLRLQPLRIEIHHD
jgi:hypothetical protein